MKVKARSLDKKFDKGADISKHLDLKIAIKNGKRLAQLAGTEKGLGGTMGSLLDT